MSCRCRKNTLNMRSTMLLFCSIILLAHNSLVEGCGSGSSSCSYQVCSASYRTVLPLPKKGECVHQYAKVVYTYQTIKKSSGCPGNQNCNQKDIDRTLCSCKIGSYCHWGSWGPFQGSIAWGECGIQKRYRYLERLWHYVHVIGQCKETAGCPRGSDSQTRTWCKCRRAVNCQPTNWSAWSGHVPDGTCRTQTSYKNFTATYWFRELENNCGHFNLSCPPKETISRQYCMCPYYNCQLEEWTAWNVVTGSGACPKEERFRNFNSTLLYKGAQSTCAGIGPSSCPVRKREERKKPVSCPALLAPANGTLVGSGCNGKNSSCGSTCSVSCNAGFPLQGSDSVVCQADGSWSGTLGQCIGNQV